VIQLKGKEKVQPSQENSDNMVNILRRFQTLLPPKPNERITTLAMSRQ
jgi:hypothetical protein